MQSLKDILIEAFSLPVEEVDNSLVVTLSPEFWALRKSLAQVLKKQTNHFELKNQKLIVPNSLILEPFFAPRCSNELMTTYLNGKVNITTLLTTFSDPLIFSDVSEYLPELELRGIVFDFNDAPENKTIVGIDAEDRIKFISLSKYTFERDLEDLMEKLLQKDKNPEIESFIFQKIKPYIIQAGKVKETDLEFYSHMIDYLNSDKFKDEIGYTGLYGASLDSIKERVRKWSAIKKTRVMDEPKGNKEVFEVDNFTWFELMSEQALDFESNEMGHCVGQGSYDKSVAEGKVKIYSLRDSKNTPHVTIEIREGKLNQIKGVKNGLILAKYRKATAAFIKNYLQMDLN